MDNPLRQPLTKRKVDRQAIGRWGEEEAARFLSAQGYVIIARNVRTPYGEIDLIASCGGLLVFVEVKTRTSRFGGDPESAVTRLKEEHIAASIDEYLSGLEIMPEEWRVDVIAVTGSPGRAGPEIIWFEDALG